MTAADTEAPFSKAEVAWARRLLEEYAFTLEDIPRMVRVRLYQVLGEEDIEVEQSHYLHAEGMATPAVPATQRYGSANEALDDVLEHFLAGYRSAIEAGHRPGTHWLLPNRDFN